jgi:hypothetical protein
MKDVLLEFARTAAAVVAQHLQDARRDATPDERADGSSCSAFKATVSFELQEEGQTTCATITLSNEAD